MATFKETMETFKAACKAGDVKAIAAQAKCSEQTVRNLFKRTAALELTEKEKEVFNICRVYLQPKIEDAKRLERQAKSIMEGL